MNQQNLDEKQSENMSTLLIDDNILCLIVFHTIRNISFQVIADWFVRKNVDDTVIIVTIFITATNQVCLITHNIAPLQSGSVFFEPAKLTSAQYNA